jgi:sulfhydrogenase subunit alpha
MHTADRRRTFHTGELTRVEGSGSLDVVVVGDEIVDLDFRMFEAPRFYEAMLRGRSYLEAPDITARICGICPVAHQTSAANAIERILAIDPGPSLRDLRHILYMAEWIESHALHVSLLHAPDFLGYPSAIAMAADFGDEVSRALRLKQVGNSIMALIGGREIHPVNPRVGGFWKAPTRRELHGVVGELEWALDAALDTVRLVAGFSFPDFEVDHELVALHSPDEYAVLDGRIHSSAGVDIDAREWDEVFVEEQVARSNALHARVRARGAYLTGPLARYTLNGEQLHPVARSAARNAGLGSAERNPFRSIIVRSVEIVHAVATILDILDRFVDPPASYLEAPPRAGEGHGVSEAPRGLLYHRYVLDDEGTITDAQIVAPTSQNQLPIEQDLRSLLPTILDQPDDLIRSRLEHAVRNHDPCISCAAHFLDLRIDRR